MGTSVRPYATAPAASAAAASKGNGHALVKRKVLKFFGGKPFGGVVTKYFPRRKLYGIKYKDGDEEELDECELAVIIVGGMPMGGDDVGDDATGAGTDLLVEDVPRPATRKPAAAARASPSASAAAAAAAAAGRELVDRKVVKTFDGEPYSGVVTAFYSGIYHVRYDDGDEEEMEGYELERVIVGGMALGGKGGTGGAGRTGGKGGIGGKVGKVGKERKGGKGGEGKGNADKGVGKEGPARQGSLKVRQLRLNR